MSCCLNVSIALISAFEESEDDVSVHPEWLLEAPEELDVSIAQRHFENALGLLERAKEYTQQYVITQGNQHDHILTEIQRKVTSFTIMSLLFHTFSVYLCYSVTFLEFI